MSAFASGATARSSGSRPAPGSPPIRSISPKGAPPNGTGTRTGKARRSGMSEKSESLPIFTVGHSTRSLEEFVELLRAGEVRLLVDVRSVPRSRTNPQYNIDSLPGALADYQIGHVRIGALGGLRKKSATVAPETNAFWSNRSFHNYADHALSEDFRLGLDELTTLAAERRTAIMCAEAVWWRCHRRIIADYLIHAGWPVFHLMDEAKIVPARPTPGLQPCADGLHYPLVPQPGEKEQKVKIRLTRNATSGII